MPEWHSYGNNSTVFVCFDATEMAISIQSAFEELKRSFTRRKVANPHPSWTTVETIGGSPPKVLRIELFSDKVSVAAESQEMAIAIKRHDATSEQIERLRQATARFEVSWNTQAYKSLFADLPDLIVEEIEIVQEVVAVLVNFVGGVPVLNGYVVLPLDRDDDLDRATALILERAAHLPDAGVRQHAIQRGSFTRSIGVLLGRMRQWIYAKRHRG